MSDYKKYKEVLEEASLEAAKILLDNFDTDFKISRKKHYSDLVTEVDKKSETKIIEVIHSRYPEHKQQQCKENWLP